MPLAPAERALTHQILTRTGMAFAALTAVLWALHLAGLSSISSPAGRVPGAIARLALSTLPSVALMTLPAGFLLGVLLVLGRTDGAGGGARLPRPVLALAMVGAVLTFVLVGWVLPRANQAYRRAYYDATGTKPPLVIKADREMPLRELGAFIKALHRQGRDAEATALRVEWHKKLALPAAWLVLGLLGTGLAPRGGARSAGSTLAIFAAVITAYYALLRLGEQAGDEGRIPPLVAAWGANLFFGAVAALLLALGGGRAASRSSGTKGCGSA